MTTQQQTHVEDGPRTTSDPTSTLGLVGVAGVAAFALAFGAMHLIQTDLNPLASFGSDYALGRAGWLMRLGFLSAGIGTLALAVGLHRSLRSVRGKRLAVTLTGLGGLGFFGSGVFDTDPPRPDGTTGYTTEGAIHDLAGFVLFVSSIIGAFVLARVFRRDPRWTRWSAAARGFAWAILGGLVATIVAGEAGTPPDEGFVGLAQRIFLLVLLSWFILIGSQIRTFGSGRDHFARGAAPISRAGGGDQP